MTLKELCWAALREKNLEGDKQYEKRLKWELNEILAREKENYFLDLVKNKVRYPHNENNLLICWLLGIVPDFNIGVDPHCINTGDLPDVDIDYLEPVRDYLKNEWAIKTFGEEYVCNIGNYGTFGLKSVLIDMARVHDKDRTEIMALTKQLKLKDDEGKALTWDGAMRLYPELKKYCEENKDVAEAAQKLLNRNRGMGVHAGGLIISSIPLSDLVPLVKRKGDPQASAWPEGLKGQDLQPVGLVKFDLLVINNLLQVAKTCKLIKERHPEIKNLWALPGQSDWSDVKKWRNDPAALAMADQGDLKCIFQFDSDGIRALVKAGGVTRFEDLVNYTSLWRPGPLNCLKKDTKVKTFVGKKCIEKLEPGYDKIAYVSSNGQLKYTNKYFVTKTGKKKLLKITTRTGKVLYASPEHLIFSEGNQFVRADILKKNSKIAIIK